MIILEEKIPKPSSLYRHKITLNTITPLLMHGANPRERAETRATSFKGVIRYWWRVLQTKPSRLRNEETKLFGGAGAEGGGAASPLRLSVSKLEGNRFYLLRPHRGGARGNATGIYANQKFDFEWAVLNKDKKLQDEYKAILEFCFALGSFGQRARRGYGTLHVEGITWTTVEEYEKYLWELISNISKVSQADFNNVADIPYPLLRSIWIGSAEQTSNEVLRKIGQASSVAKKHSQSGEYHLGGVGRSRLASPLHASVRKIDNVFYPVIAETRPKRDPHEEYVQQRNVFLRELGVDLNE